MATDERGTQIDAARPPADPGATSIDRKAAADAGGESDARGAERLIDGRFEVESQLKVFSAEADIYLVRDDSGTKYILKYYRYNIEPKEEIVEKLKTLSSEDVIRLIEFGKSEDGRFYELQEYAEYGSLADHLASEKKPPAGFIRDFIKELNLCLEEIHSKNIIHRDIKPSNILIRTMEPLDLILTDFGISSVSNMSLHQTNLSRTISYSSPESITGVISKSVDYWSMGLIVLEMLIGSHPFESMDHKAILYSLVTRHVPFAEEVAGEFAAVVRGLLTRDDKKRWGAKEINLWLGNAADIPVHFEDDPAVSARAGRAKPYRFAGAEYRDPQSLALGFAKNWDAARDELAGGGVLEWLEKEVEARDVHFIAGCILRDGALTADEKLFEFIARVNPQAGFFYRGSLVTVEYISMLAGKIAFGSASDYDKKVLGELFGRGVIRKYFEIAGDQAAFEKNYSILCRDAAEMSTPEDVAAAVLIDLVPEFRRSYAENVLKKCDGMITVGLPSGYSDCAEVDADLARVRAGSEISAVRLVRLFSAQTSCFKSRVVIDDAAEAVRNKLKRMKQEGLGMVDLIDLMSSSEKYSSAGKTFVNDLIDGNTAYDKKFFDALRLVSEAVDELTKRRQARSSAFSPSAQSGAAETEFAGEVIKSANIKFLTENFPLGVATGCAAMVGNMINAPNPFSMVFAYFIGYAFGGNVGRALSLERRALARGVHEIALAGAKNLARVLFFAPLCGFTVAAFSFSRSAESLFISGGFAALVCAVLAYSFSGFVIDDVVTNAETYFPKDPYLHLLRDVLNHCFRLILIFQLVGAGAGGFLFGMFSWSPYRGWDPFSITLGCFVGYFAGVTAGDYFSQNSCKETIPSNEPQDGREGK